MSNVRSLRPAEPSADLRAAANLATRLGGDAERYGFTELAARCKERAHELDKDADRAALFERAAIERRALWGGATNVMEIARRHRTVELLVAAIEPEAG